MVDIFDLTGRIAIITGGAGLLGRQHAEAVAAAGAIPVLADIRGAEVGHQAAELSERLGVPVDAISADVTDPPQIQSLLARVLARYDRVDILINNAANDPKVESSSDVPWSRLEQFPLEQWHADLNVGLTGALVCSQIIGGEMARRGRGVILNIASDLSVIAPDQRIYRHPDAPEDRQPVKPVSYAVIKTALIGLTRYLATYWAHTGVRVNAISPGGVFAGQPEEFVRNLTRLIPQGRMARQDEYQGAIVFLCSDASSYMTGYNLIIDGGRSSW